MASKKLSSDTSLANSYKLSRGLASVARPSAPTIGTATDGGSGLMSVTFIASTLGPSASSYTLTSSSGVTSSGASSPLALQEIEVGTYTYSVYGTNANGNGPSSAASNSVNVASVWAPIGAYDSIATTTLTTNTTSITFSSIPATYTHLQIRGIARDTTADVATSAILIRFNSDTSTTYPRHYLYGDGSTVGAGFSTPVGDSYAGTVALNNNTSGIFASNIIDIFDYANTNKYKTLRSLSGADVNGSGGGIVVNSNLWQSTAAINTIRLSSATGNPFVQYTQLALYGIKGN